MIYEGEPGRRVDAGREERRARHPIITIINEQSPGNMLTNMDRRIDLMASSYVSGLDPEGYGTGEKQTKLADFYISTFGLASRGSFLDVGYGRNLFVSGRMAERGIRAYAVDLDSQLPRKDMWHAPRYAEQTEQEGVVLLTGDISQANAKDSDLQDQRFGSVLFNGSWLASEDHLTVGAKGAAYDKILLGETTPYYEVLEREKVAILRVTRNLLRNNGVMGFVSPRYAYYGSEFGFDHYVDEKLTFVDLYSKLVDLNPSNIYIVGMSPEGLADSVERSATMTALYGQQAQSMDAQPISEATTVCILEQLSAPQNINLAEQVGFMKQEPGLATERARLQAVLDRTAQTTELRKVARIDAIFAVFPKAA